jgi:hypothetical protein
MEELAKLFAKASAEVEALTKKNTELQQELESMTKKTREERSQMVRSHFEDLSAVKDTERKRAGFLAEIVNRPLKRAREIAAEDDFDIRVKYENGKYCPQPGGTEALNPREVCVSVVDDMIMGCDATNRGGDKIWCPAALFSYRI